MRHIKMNAVIDVDMQLERLSTNIARAIKSIENEFGESDAEINVSIAPVFALTKVVGGTPDYDGYDDIYDEDE